MMPLNLSLLMPAVLGISALAGLLVLVLEWRATRRLKRERRELEETLAGLKKEIHGAVEMGVKASRRARKAEHHLKQLSDRLALLEARGEGRDYERAISLVRKGADAGKLVSNFGMSRGEAELVARLHGQQKRSA